MRYVSLHSHSTFSYGDGYGPVESHVARVAELGMKALALTEHGNTSSHAQLEKACRSHGVKPIFGCELYEAPTDPKSPDGDPIKTRRKYHQTVLAKNEEGLRNLNRIVTASWRDHFFQWPTTTSRLLKDNSKGLVVLSGCADSLLSCTLLGGKENGEKRLSYTDEDLERAVGVVQWYQSVFGEDYYLEVQRFPGLERTCVLNPAFEKISEVTGAKLCASSDVHYPLPEHNDMQRILHAAHRGGTVESADASWEYDILLTYPTSDREIFEDLVGTGLSKRAAKQAILNTENIAEGCTVELPKNEPIKYPISDEDWEDW
jgi:DNA polymerase-3 subunit alpha